VELNKMSIFIVKVTTNKEERALDLIVDRSVKKELNVYAVSRPHGLKGYILLEAEDRDSAEEAAFNLPYVKGIIGKTISYEEVKNMLEPTIETISIHKGDIVEILAEPFKKEKAKVLRIDKQKGEIVVSLLAAVVPMPVTIKIDNIKVIRRDEANDDEEGEGKQNDKAEQIEEDINDTTDNFDDTEGNLFGGP
jgi:transcription termination/antitermination protein NusG